MHFTLALRSILNLACCLFFLASTTLTKEYDKLGVHYVLDTLKICPKTYTHFFGVKSKLIDCDKRVFQKLALNEKYRWSLSGVICNVKHVEYFRLTDLKV